ncbi:MAG: NADH:flavin oxidoreductase [Fusobacteriaceae bacterium]
MKTIFETTNFKNLTMKNRLFRGALWEELATDDGHLTPELSSIYEEIAKGGVGTILTGYAYISENIKPNTKMLGIYSDKFIPEYQKFTKKIHDLGSNIIMQVAYGNDLAHSIKNEEISKNDIKNIINLFTEAAIRVKKSGFAGIELHAGHGYILSQFLSSKHNTRNDEYGGSIDNRGRIIFEIVDCIRKAVGPDFPILIKINSQDFLNESGYTEEDSLFICKKLSEIGIDAIEITGGDETFSEVLDNNLGPARKKIFGNKEKESYFRNFAKKLSLEINIPVILIGGNRSIEVMNEILNDSNISYFSLSRPLTCEPNLINRWTEGDSTPSKCVSCNQCYSTYGKRCIFNIKKAQIV